MVWARIASAASLALCKTAAISDDRARRRWTPAVTTTVTPNVRANSVAMDRASSSSLWPTKAKTDVVALRRPGRARLRTRNRHGDRADMRQGASQEVHAEAGMREHGRSPESIWPLSDREWNAPAPRTVTRRAHRMARRPPVFRGSGRMPPVTRRPHPRPGLRAHAHAGLEDGTRVPAHSRTRLCWMLSRSRIRPTV